MFGLKFSNLLPLTVYFFSFCFVAKAAPVTYTGAKGQYTVDREAGIYNGSKVYAYEKNKEIFQDSFVNIQASTNKTTTAEVKYGLITPNCIGSACLGMTFGQLKAKLGDKVKYKTRHFMWSIDAVQVIQDGKVQYEICYDGFEKLQDKDKIYCLSTDNSYYRTKEDVGPGTSVLKAEQVYGKSAIKYYTVPELTEFLKFSKLPVGYERIAFRAKVKSEEVAGDYSARSDNTYHRDIKIKPDAYIWQITIHPINE
jgi:hypothetical protein